MADLQQRYESVISMKKAYKRKIGFLSNAGEEKYRIFLKQQILSLKPRFYAVVHKREIPTSDGLMFVIRITKDIEHPGFESIAEAWINGQLIYLWRDHCWGIAVNKDGKQIIKYDQDVVPLGSTKGPSRVVVQSPTGLKFKSSYLNKTVLLFKIGCEEI